MEELPAAPSIFDPDFPSTKPMTAVLDRMSVYKAQEKREKSERRLERQKSSFLLDPCGSDEALRRSMEVLGGLADDLENNLKITDLTTEDYQDMLEETVEELKRIQSYGVGFLSRKRD